MAQPTGPRALTRLPAPLADRLSKARRRAFVGRAQELTEFREVLAGAPEGRTVLLLHGVGGVGKSALIHRFADDAAAAGRAVVELDCRTVAGRQAHFRTKANQALHLRSAVLLIDAFEHCQDEEEWLRDHFLPHLPEDAVVVVAGRQPVGPQWTLDAGWAALTRVVRLNDLGTADAVELLRTCGVPDERHGCVLRFAGGHPLALRLAAEAITQDDDHSAEWAPPPEVISTLLMCLLDEPPTPVHLRALEICAHTLITTEELLRAVLPEHDAAALFTWLRRLPFVEHGERGLFPRNVLRRVLDADLRWRDPEGFTLVHQGLRAHLVGRVRSAPPEQLMARTRELIHLCRLHRQEGPVPEGGRHAADGTYEDEFREEDRAAVLRVAVWARGAAFVPVIRFWLDRRPSSVRTYRSCADGRIVAFLLRLRLAGPVAEESAADPAVAAAWTHVARTGPLGDGEHIVVVRGVVDPAALGVEGITDLLSWRQVADVFHADQPAWSFRLVHGDTPDWLARWGFSDTGTVVREGIPVHLNVRDPRAAPAEELLGCLDRRLGLRTERKPAARVRAVHDSRRPEFDAAVKDALRCLHNPAELSANPLLRDRALAGEFGDSSPETLRAQLAEVIAQLAETPRTVKHHRVLTATYLNGNTTQAGTAERLAMPFSTYRRHLTAGVQLVCDHLWNLRSRRPA
ncbi:ATP-binding protein [Lentzea sp. NPDC004789]